MRNGDQLRSFPTDDTATMYMVDIEMSRPEVTDLPLFELDAVAVVEPGGD